MYSERLSRGQDRCLPALLLIGTLCAFIPASVLAQTPRPPVRQFPERPKPANPRPIQPQPANTPRRPAPVAAAPSVAAPALSRLDYRMGVADLIRVQVHDEADLTLETRLDEKGTVTYPFLGEIRAVGLTVRELESRISVGLRSGYLLNPEVRVQVLEYRPFYVNGEVKRPGGYPYVPGLTVQKAVSLAGGLTHLASKNKIFVIREKNADGSREGIRLDGTVLPGDTLVIEEGLF